VGRRFPLVFFVFLSLFPLFGESPFKRGEELFLQNKPREAAAILESALVQEPRNEKIYLYLGISYEQLKNHDKAISLMQRGLDFAVQYKDLLYYNLGNNFFSKGDGEKALEMYSKAIGVNGTLSDAYLNRANTQVKMDKLEGALNDYTLYLTMEPETPQRPQIEQMIRLLKNIFVEREAEKLAVEQKKREEEEKKRIEEEQVRIAEEKRKQEEERRRKEEAERQKALLDEVMRSLQAASGDAANLSAEKEDIREKREEVDIED
jgi:tetratricopeptide (TPR) repeat protein